MGFYHAQLERYFEKFDRDRIRVYLYEDLTEDPVSLLRDVFGFLGVEESFVPNLSVKHNVSGIPRSRTLHAFLSNPGPIKSAVKPFVPERMRQRLVANLKMSNLRSAPGLAEEVRKDLVEVYRDDILELQGLIQRDLSGSLR